MKISRNAPESQCPTAGYAKEFVTKKRAANTLQFMRFSLVVDKLRES